MAGVGGSGEVPEVHVTAKNVHFDGLGISQGTGILTSAAGTSIGGAIHIDSKSLTFLDGAFVATLTTGMGDAGTIHVDVAEAVELSGTTISSIIGSRTLGSGMGGNITVLADVVQLQGRGAIVAETSGIGDGGTVDISADQLLLSGAGAVNIIPFFEGGALRSDLTEGRVTVAETAFISAATRGLGNAGNVKINTRILELFDASFISAATFSAGNAGHVTIHADSTTILGGPLGFTSGISSSSLLFTDGGGDGQSIEIIGSTLELGVGAVITGDSVGSGNAGDLTIAVDRLFVDGGGSDRLTTMSVNSNSPTDTSGDGGNMKITAKEMTLKHRTGISAATLGAGKGGRIDVTANRLLLDGRGNHAAIIVAALGTGGGGSVHVESESIQLINGGFISATSLTSAVPGSVEVVAEDLLIDGKGLTPVVGRGTFLITGLGAEAFDDTNGGNERADVNLALDSLRITGKGTITTATFGSRPGGKITMNTSSLQLRDGGTINSFSTGLGDAGSIIINAYQSVQLDHGSITTESSAANGGNISINTGALINLTNSKITAQAKLNGGEITMTTPFMLRLNNSDFTAEAGNNGGNIFIDPDFVILDNSDLIARAVTGDGGDIRIATDVFLQSSDSVIDASSEFGVSGNIEILAPDIDIAGSLATLPEFLTISEIHLQPACAVRLPETFSSLTVQGKDRRPFTPGELLIPSH